jgi:diguanylate cyclase (GGDEF)-like protein
LFVDLDRFKLVNDIHGHTVGDELLIAVAKRLTAALRPGDTLARMSGDEFVILCEDLVAAGELDIIAKRIVDAVAAPFVLSGVQVEVTASVGIAYSGRGDDLSGALLEDADAAMYQAKRKGGARHQIVDLREQRLAAQRASLEHDLRGARMRGELRTVYQPIVDVADARIVGVEALLRWEHPSRGLVTPDVIIPLAEQAGFITDIGRWVLEQACADRIRFSQAHAPAELTMSVNVSALQLMAPDFAADVAAVLARTRTEPRLLTLEITESVFVQDSERAHVVLNELKSAGVLVALDDFGTGYSSLSYLKRFPIDIVKIDRCFIADLATDDASRAIVIAVVELAQRLGKHVIAEGVENAEQLQLLRTLTCDKGQGYHFARPMSADALELQLLGAPRTGETLDWSIALT